VRGIGKEMFSCIESSPLPSLPSPPPPPPPPPPSPPSFDKYENANSAAEGIYYVCVRGGKNYKNVIKGTIRLLDKGGETAYTGVTGATTLTQFDVAGLITKCCKKRRGDAQILFEVGRMLK
jgi:hypothetical protein